MASPRSPAKLQDRKGTGPRGAGTGDVARQFGLSLGRIAVSCVAGSAGAGSSSRARSVLDRWRPMQYEGVSVPVLTGLLRSRWSPMASRATKPWVLVSCHRGSAGGKRRKGSWISTASGITFITRGRPPGLANGCYSVLCRLSSSSLLTRYTPFDESRPGGSGADRGAPAAASVGSKGKQWGKQQTSKRGNAITYRSMGGRVV